MNTAEQKVLRTLSSKWRELGDQIREEALTLGPLAGHARREVAHSLYSNASALEQAMDGSLESPSKTVTLRRNMQQLVHCCTEALSVVENGEDPRCAIDDLDAAMGLLRDTLKRLRNEADKVDDS